MPAFDLRGIKVATYVNTAGTITYTGAQSIGDAMNVDMQLKYAEGRLYAESRLAEYMKKATGGTISIGVKYIPSAAQKVLFGARDNTRSITVGGTTSSVSSLQYGSKDEPKYVGVGFYAPDMIDGAQKYTAVFITKAIFGQPGMTYHTMDENIDFDTPTTTGEFMANDATGQEMLEIAVCDSEAAAQAWITAVLQ